jgi:2',3'-cyclic-nucleotide 2'-phosphodiesterase (5'-nucleotidase family)
MSRTNNKVLALAMIVMLLVTALALPAAAQPAPAPPAPVTFTILHTNDFHGQLEQNSGGSTSNPGMARVAKVINDVRAANTAAGKSTLLVDAGDEMQGSLLSNIWQGVPTIDVFNNMSYEVGTFGNHEFDWGQTVLGARTGEATYPYVTANIVKNDTGNCATAGWTKPDFADAPYFIKTVGTAPNEVKVAFIGVTTPETPIITISSATAGLCFKDPAASILNYYDAIKAQADVIVILSHLGFADGGYGYGIPIYGDQTLAKKLNDAGKPVNLIIGGHSHTDVVLTNGQPPKVGNTVVVQARYNGRQVGRADITVGTDGSVAIDWSKLNPTSSGAPDAAIEAVIKTYTDDPDYQALINQEIGWTNVPITRNYDGDSLMGYFVNDAIYNDLNTDAKPENDVDIVFNNPGGLRTDISCAVYPCKLTFGMMFNILPFGNQTIVGKMTGARIMELLNQAASLSKGAIQPAGLRYKFYNYRVDTDPTSAVNLRAWSWGAFDACVIDKSDGSCDPLDLTKTYQIATNEFLAPAGQDNFYAFKYVTNISYWGDMLDGVNRWVSKTNTAANPYNGALDGRITRDGNDAGGSIIPITILHHNDMHGNLYKGTYVGYTQLATLIKQERAFNPTRTLLLNSGDDIQGDGLSFYFKTAPLGYTADGTPLTGDLTTNPVMGAMNMMNYDAMTLGNHEFNFGKDVFTSVLGQANFPVLQANLEDDGQYGIDKVPVEDYVEKTVGGEGVKVAILGIGNHRIPNYELPSNIPGLTFGDPLVKAQELSDKLRSTNDVVIALTHIGFTEDPKSVEVDKNVDTNMAKTVTGLDAIIGGHSHTNPATGFGEYKYLPTLVPDPDQVPVIINHAYRYNNTLGEIFIGLRPKTGGGYEVVTRAGQYLSVGSAVAEDTGIKTMLDPYITLFNTYNNTEVGKTTVPIDALKAYTEETNGANLQADSAVFELAKNGIDDVDFHLSGAMSNRKVADAATEASPVTLKVADMFTLMPYENSLVTMRMNGPQIKAVLERAYRNFYYYKYFATAVPQYGGYSYYTTCMIDINEGGKITYNDLYPAAYDANVNHVVSLVFDGKDVDFTDADTYYKVSTVNYLAAGSCNFNNNGVSLWPLNQIVNDTQFYVRDAVIDYITAMGTVSPAIEGRLQFTPPNEVKMNAWIKQTPGALVMTQGSAVKVRVMAHNLGQATDAFLYVPLSPHVAYVPDSATGGAYPVTAAAAAALAAKHGSNLAAPEGAPANEVIGVAYDAPGLQPGDIVNFDFKVTVTTNGEGTIEHFMTISADGKLFKTLSANPVALAARVTDAFGPQQDTYIQSGAPAANYGTAAFLHVRVDAAGNDILRTLVGYDLLSVKPEYLVEKATLSVYLDAFSGGAVDGQIQVHEVTLNWAENTATWKTPWVKPGGDFVEDAVGAAAIDKNMVGKWVKIDVTPLIAKWVADPTSNHGVLLRLRKVSSITGYRFASTTTWAPENAPKLEVTYRKP